jgi:adenylate cyclase class 2
MSTQAGSEVEVKIPLLDAPATGKRLATTGFTVSVPREFESNTLYDTPDGKLRQAEMLLRLRQVGSRCVVTWKGPSVPGPHKSRPELETTVGSLETLDLILRQLGYRPAFRYEKYRTELVNPNDAGKGTVTFDETPIGHFMELEGPPGWIDQTAQRLGFTSHDYVLESYGKLYLDDCARRGVQPGNMVFAPPPVE